MSVSGKTQVSLRSDSGQSQVSPRSIPGQSKVPLSFIKTEPKILRLVERERLVVKNVHIACCCILTKVIKPINIWLLHIIHNVLPKEYLLLISNMRNFVCTHLAFSGNYFIICNYEGKYIFLSTNLYVITILVILFFGPWYWWSWIELQKNWK